MDQTPTQAPTDADIDDWCERTGVLSLLAQRSYVPGQGIDLTAYVIAFTLPNGTHQFNALPGADLDPTSNPTIRAMVDGVIDQFGPDSKRIRKYTFNQRMGTISPYAAAASNNEQTKLNDPSTWTNGRLSGPTEIVG